jgi:large repetitive protein
MTVAITTVNLPYGRVSSWYSAQLKNVGGGPLLLTWSLSQGMSLPPGLQLSPSGLVSGMPTAVTVNVRVRVEVQDTEVQHDAALVGLDILPAFVDETNPNFHFANGDYYYGI